MGGVVGPEIWEPGGQRCRGVEGIERGGNGVAMEGEWGWRATEGGWGSANRQC